MLNWAVTFFVIAIIAAVLGFTNIAGSAIDIAKILFLVFLVPIISGIFIFSQGPRDPSWLKQNSRIVAGISSGQLSPMVSCDKTAFIKIGASGNTQLISAVSGQSIYVCMLDFSVPLITSVGIVEGTGTNCATGEAELIDPMPMPINGSKDMVSPFSFMNSHPSMAVCIKNTTANGISGVIGYTQF